MKPAELLEAMVRCDTGAERGAMVGFRELRQQFPQLRDRYFDSAILGAVWQARAERFGRFDLHAVDMPANMTPEQRSVYVNSGNSWYVGLAFHQWRD